MSATRSSAAAPVTLPARGFSLLELLVALFVVIMVTSLVSLNVSPGGGDLRLETQLRNLVGVAGYALDEAEFLGRDFGLLLQELDEGGERVYSYEWRERLPAGWREPRPLAGAGRSLVGAGAGVGASASGSRFSASKRMIQR